MAILFLCTANRCRSQMAEGIYRTLAPGEAVHSGGTQPSEVHPLAVRVLAEIGIDIASQVSKGIDAVPIETIETVITVCDDAAACPNPAPGARHIHWSIDDPDRATGTEEEIVEAFRRARDELKERITALLTDRPPTGRLAPPSGEE